MKKVKVSVAFLLAMMMLALCACGDTAGTPSNSPSSAQPSPSDTASDAPSESPSDAAPAAPAEFDGKLHGPFVMTTCGQSTGSVMFHMVAVQAGLTSTDEHQLMDSELDSVAAGAQTLVITTGTSGKGMGAAGTDVDDEIARCTAVANAAKAKGMTVVAAHIEGMSRRTDANDQASIDAILPLADVIVCVEDSNSDNYFSDYASANNIPIIIVPDSLGLSEYME